MVKRVNFLMLYLATFAKLSHSFCPSPFLKEVLKGRRHLSLIQKSPSRTPQSHTILTTSSRRYQSSTNEEFINMQQIFGGDLAGTYAQFESTTGKVIPVPEHYVPQSMIEWGQVPSCLEVIVSEDILINDGDNNMIVIDRTTVQVMPEVGCGLDNLDTIKLKESIPLKPEHDQNKLTSIDNLSLNGVDATSVYIPEKNRVEFIFTVHSNSSIQSDITTVKDENSVSDEESMDVTRIRVGVNLFPNKLQVKSPIDMTKERKISNISTKGTIADGGGLDARTVSKLVGRDNINNPFCEQKGLELEKVINGSWTVYDSESTTTNNEKIIKNIDTKDSTILSLPENVILTFGGSPLVIEASLIVLGKDDERADSVRKIVIKRSLHYDENDPNVISSSTDYFWEDKIN